MIYNIQMRKISQFLIAFIISFALYISLFSFIYIFKLNNLILQSEDYLGSVVLPFSILKEGNFDLNEYFHELTMHYPQPDNALETPYYLRRTGEYYYSIRPVLTPLIALPIYIIPILLDTPVNIETIRIMSRIGGAFITALSAGFFWLALKELTQNRKIQVMVFIIYAFGTNSLSTSSQGLWQHGTSQLLLSIALYLILKNRHTLSGLFFGLSIIARPTNLLSFVVFWIYLILRRAKIKEIINYTLLGILPVVAEFIFNQLVFGNADNAGYAEQTSGWRNNIFEGFAGLWISPSKGIFINTPVFIFLLYGFYESLKYISSKLKNLNFNDKTKNIFATSTIIVLAHTFIMGRWYSWYGGYSWGYRMASDVLPFMVILLIPFLEKIFTEKRIIYIRTVYLLTALSILLHLSSFVFFDGIWHNLYDGKSPNWLWSIENSEFVFDAKRGLSKMGLIDNPITKVK